MKRLVVFDLDGTLIDSSHRTPHRPDGTLDLERYFELENRENIFRDTLLPLAKTFKRLNRSENYIVICTARAMNQNDYDFLAAHGLDAHKILCRTLDGSEKHIKDAKLKRRKIQRLMNLRQFSGLPVVMFDDAKPIIAEMRKIGVACLNAIKVNKKLMKS